MENRGATYGLSKEQFKQAVSVALLRRVGPGRSMTFKQLAYAIRVPEQSVWAWAKAENAPQGWALMNLLTFFDAAFANEIAAGTGCTIIKMDERKRREVLDALAVLARAAG